MKSPRFRIEGAMYYITTVVYGRLKIFTKPSFIIPLIDSLNFYRYQYKTKLIGYVIMPDHFHIIVYPESEKAITDFMRDFKRFSSGRISRQAELESKTDWLEHFRQAGSETNRAERKVWQDHFWEVCVYSESILEQKLNYIHLNPVRAELVTEPGLYPYSSFRNYHMGDNSLIEMDQDWW